MKKAVIALIIGALLVPHASFAQTDPRVQEQISILIQLVQTLQKQLDALIKEQESAQRKTEKRLEVVETPKETVKSPEEGRMERARAACANAPENSNTPCHSETVKDAQGRSRTTFYFGRGAFCISESPHGIGKSCGG